VITVNDMLEGTWVWTCGRVFGAPQPRRR